MVTNLKAQGLKNTSLFLFVYYVTIATAKDSTHHWQSGTQADVTVTILKIASHPAYLERDNRRHENLGSGGHGKSPKCEHEPTEWRWEGLSDREA